MTFNKALSVLGIDNTYTKSSLKNAYKKLKEKYEQDMQYYFRFKEDKYKNAENKLEELEIAYKTLKEVITNNNSIDESSIINIHKEAKTHLLEEYKIYLKKYTIKNSKTLTDKDYEYLIEYDKEIKSVIKTFLSQEYNTIAEIDNAALNSLNAIKRIFKQLELDFYQIRHVDRSEITETINYNCNLNEFYNQLLKLKDKYSYETKLYERVEAVDNFRAWSCDCDYNAAAKAEIALLKEKTYNRLVNLLEGHRIITENDEKHIREYLNDLRKEIERAYDACINLHTKIITLEILAKDAEVREEYKKLRDNFNRGQLIEKTMNEIESFKLFAITKDEKYKIKDEPLEENNDSKNDDLPVLISTAQEILKLKAKSNDPNDKKTNSIRIKIKKKL